MEASKYSKRLELVNRVVLKWSGELPGLRADLILGKFHELTSKDVDLICDALIKELVENGLDHDGEPNNIGIELEDAIDWVRSSVAALDGGRFGS